MVKFRLVALSAMLALGLGQPVFAKESEVETKNQVAKNQATKRVEVSQAVKPVNINQASAEEIAGVLKGVGLVKAQAIVSYRQKNGAFKSIDELGNVKGIGPATISKNQANILLK